MGGVNDFERTRKGWCHLPEFVYNQSAQNRRYELGTQKSTYEHETTAGTRASGASREEGAASRAAKG